MASESTHLAFQNAFVHKRAMRNGAVVLLDALGFKGIWKRFPGEQVLAKLEALSQAAHAVIGSFHKHATAEDTYGMEPRIETAFGSDSIFVVATVGGIKDPILRDWACVLLASYASSALMSLGARDAPALAYRGVVAVGEFEMRQTFVVGAAVDEAAAHEKLADAALVWFAPTAEAVVRRAMQELGPQSSEPTTWTRWQVPLKGGSTYDTHVVLPFFPTPVEGPDADFVLSRAAPDRVCQEILATFDEGRVDVAIKKQHTQRFLTHALSKRQRSKPSAP